MENIRTVPSDTERKSFYGQWLLLRSGDFESYKRESDLVHVQYAEHWEFDSIKVKNRKKNLITKLHNAVLCALITEKQTNDAYQLIFLAGPTHGERYITQEELTDNFLHLSGMVQQLGIELTKDRRLDIEDCTLKTPISERYYEYAGRKRSEVVRSLLAEILPQPENKRTYLFVPHADLESQRLLFSMSPVLN